MQPSRPVTSARPAGAGGGHRPLAVVTGASRGLGAALAAALAPSHDLVLDARSAADLAAVAQRLRDVTTVTTIPGDVTDPTHRAALADAARGAELVVCNAATLGPTPLPAVADLTVADLADVLHTNVVAQVGLVTALLPRLAPAATIVGITSDAADAPYAGWGAYGASKAALEHLLAVLGVERPDLRVLVVDPGDMRTAMQRAAFPDEDLSDRPLPEEHAAPALVRLLDHATGSGRHRLDDLVVPLAAATA